VAVGGTANVYQWQKDGVDIGGATNDTLIIASASPADAGSYVLRTTNTIATDLTLYSLPVNVTIMELYPATPANLTATPGDRQVSLSWDANTEADFLRYRIYWENFTTPLSPRDSTAGDTTITITGLTNGITYYFWVTAVDSSGNESGYSAEVSATPTLFPQVVLQPGPNDGKDAYVHSGNPTLNYGNSTSLYFGGIPLSGGLASDTLNLYIQFDLSFISPGTQINSARLDLYLTGQNGWMVYDYGVYQVTQAWEEVTLTWNSQPQHNTTPVTTFFGQEWQSAYNRWHTVQNLEALVQQWVNDPANNHGLVIRAINDLYGAPRIASSDWADSTLRPKLVINSPGTGFSGIITDAQAAAPIEGVVIGAYQNDGSVRYALDTTDASGAYQLLVTFPGTYEIQVRGVNGYMPNMAGSFTVVEGEIRALDLTLQPNPNAVAGTISGVWDINGSPYIIVSDILVPTLSELVIAPGVEVRFHGRYKFIVNGVLRAVGTAADSIRFTRDEPTDESRGWGLRFENAAEDTSIVSFCIIEHGYVHDVLWGQSQDDCGGGIYCNNSNLVIERCSIRNNTANCGGGIYASMYDGQILIIRNNLIENNVAFDFGSDDGGGGITVGCASGSSHRGCSHRCLSE
jgi:hypothetical protein